MAEVIDDFGEQVGRLARQRQYDLIHAHYWLSGLAALPVALELGLPLVQSFHTLAAMKNASRGARPGARAGTAPGLRALPRAQADAMIAGSAAEAAALIEAVAAPAERTWVIPPGVDVDLFRPDRAGAEAAVRARLGVPAGRPILAVVGRRATAEKPGAGGADARRTPGTGASSRAGDRRGVHARRRRLRGGAPHERRAAGRGAGRPVRRRTVADRARGPARRRLGHRSCRPYTETFGLVALESAASGTPVLGFRGTGLVESVAEGKSGLLVDSWDPAVWAQAAAGILDDTALAARLSASARLHALDFTWPVSAAALLGIYASLLG